jgi:hypothetical protein
MTRRRFLAASGGVLARPLGGRRHPPPRDPRTHPQTVQEALDGEEFRATAAGGRLYRTLETTLLGCGGHALGYWFPPAPERFQFTVVVSWTQFRWRRILLTDLDAFPGWSEITTYLARWGCLSLPRNASEVPGAEVTPLVKAL